MSDIKPSGSTSSAIKVAVDIETQIEGKSTIQLSDGTMVDGPLSQRFVRIPTGIQDGFPIGLNEGDWLINPATNETHQVVSIAFGAFGDVGHVAITTKSGPVVRSLEELAETLLLVVNE